MSFNVTVWWAWASQFVSHALAGMASPLVIAGVLAFTTLLLEDLALAAGAALATKGAITWGAAFASVAGGIALGDLGLYVLGAFCLRFAFLRHRYLDGKKQVLKTFINRQMGSAVLLARVIPGLRFVTYTSSGYLQIPVLPFISWVVLAVSLWTAGLFWLGFSFGSTLSGWFGLPIPIAVGLVIVALACLIPVVRFVNARLT